jgi:hypothetical protein
MGVQNKRLGLEGIDNAIYILRPGEECANRNINEKGWYNEKKKKMRDGEMELHENIMRRPLATGQNRPLEMHAKA